MKTRFHTSLNQIVFIYTKLIRFYLSYSTLQKDSCKNFIPAIFSLFYNRKLSHHYFILLSHFFTTIKKPKIFFTT